MESSRAQDFHGPPVRLQVDPEFQFAMPPLDPVERELLEESLLSEGCREALVVWKSPEGPILLDGHNRREICERHGIPYETAEIELADREAARTWIDHCQIARRNLKPGAAQLLRGRLFNRMKDSWGGNRRGKSRHQGDAMKTSQRLARRFQVSRATVERDGRFASAIQELSNTVAPDLEQHILSGKVQVSRTTAIEAALSARTDPEAARRRLEADATSCEWLTPNSVLSAVSRMFGGEVDLDPCSPEGGSEVRAKRRFTVKEDGLAKDWHGTVYMNPPYGRETEKWIIKMLEEWGSGRVSEAIGLVAARTDTSWFFRLRDQARLFVRGRLRFSGAKTPASFPSVIVYWGTRVDRFQEVFGAFGDVYLRYEGRDP